LESRSRCCQSAVDITQQRANTALDHRTTPQRQKKQAMCMISVDRRTCSWGASKAIEPTGPQLLGEHAYEARPHRSRRTHQLRHQQDAGQYQPYQSTRTVELPPGTPATRTPGIACVASRIAVCSGGSIGTPAAVPISLFEQHSKHHKLCKHITCCRGRGLDCYPYRISSRKRENAS
jgi:hypothetical protein